MIMIMCELKSCLLSSTNYCTRPFIAYFDSLSVTISWYQVFNMGLVTRPDAIIFVSRGLIILE